MDTVILIDILKDEHRQFQEMLYKAVMEKETLIIPTVVFAELMPQFGGDQKQIGLFLKEHQIGIEVLDLEAVLVAARRWMQYLRRKTRLKCPECGHILDPREHLLSDFYIGGFSVSQCHDILTRDRGIYRKYFPELKGYMNCLKH